MDEMSYLVLETTEVSYFMLGSSEVIYLVLGSSEVVDDVTDELVLSSVQRLVRLVTSDTGDFFTLLE